MLKALTTQVASLTTDINTIKTCSAHKGAKHYPDSYEANTVSQQPQASYRQPARPNYQPQPQASSFRQTAPAYLQPALPFNTQARTGPSWKSQPNAKGQFTRPPRPQLNNWRSQQQPQQYDSGNGRQTDFSAPINNQGLCPYHQYFGNQARNCKPGCMYYAKSSSIAALD